MPSPGSGYDWDPHWNFDTMALAPVPAALLPRQPEARPDTQPIEQTHGLSPYAEAALKRACSDIVGAPAGRQEATLNSECFSIGTLAGASGVPEAFARHVLNAAARRIRDYDVRRPWRITACHSWGPSELGRIMWLTVAARIMPRQTSVTRPVAM